MPRQEQRQQHCQNQQPPTRATPCSRRPAHRPHRIVLSRLRFRDCTIRVNSNSSSGTQKFSTNERTAFSTNGERDEKQLTKTGCNRRRFCSAGTRVRTSVGQSDGIRDYFKIGCKHRVTHLGDGADGFAAHEGLHGHRLRGRDLDQHPGVEAVDVTSFKLSVRNTSNTPQHATTMSGHTAHTDSTGEDRARGRGPREAKANWVLGNRSHRSHRHDKRHNRQ